MTEPLSIADRLKAALSEMQRIRNGELPKVSYKEMMARIRKEIADEERGEADE